MLEGRLLNGRSVIVERDAPNEHERASLQRRLEAVRADRLRGTGFLIGHAGFHGPPGVNGGGVAGALEVGYTDFPRWRGTGLATEAVRGLVQWVRETHGVEHFFSSVAPGNEPSIAVLDRLGFAHVG